MKLEKYFQLLSSQYINMCLWVLLVLFYFILFFDAGCLVVALAPQELSM